MSNFLVEGIQRKYNFAPIIKMYKEKLIHAINIKTEGVFDYLQAKGIIEDWKTPVMEAAELTLEVLLNYVKQNDFQDLNVKQKHVKSSKGRPPSSWHIIDPVIKELYGRKKIKEIFQKLQEMGYEKGIDNLKYRIYHLRKEGVI